MATYVTEKRHRDCHHDGFAGHAAESQSIIKNREVEGEFRTKKHRNGQKLDLKVFPLSATQSS